MKRTHAIAMALDPAATLPLPLVGEAHPLRRRYQQLLFRALCLAAAIHMTVVGGFLVAALFETAPPPPEIIVVDLTKILPPPIDPRKEPAVRVQIEQPAPEQAGIPVPVPDPLATSPTILPNDRINAPFVPTDISDLTGRGGDSIRVIVPEAQVGDAPLPGDFVAVEEMPFLIALPPPVYPEMARQAEVEGTVMVRALVGKDGKVKEAFVTKGVPMLNDAALAAARQATFRPALQQHKPVAVWVQIPLRFRLD